MNVRFNYRYLVGLCLAAASFPALSAIRDAPLKIGDTTYYQVEGGVQLKGGQLAEHNRNTMKLIPIEREIYQRQTSKIVVDAHKVSAPVQVQSRWGAGKVSNSVKNLLKDSLTKRNLAGLAATSAVAMLLDKVDWLIHEGSVAHKKIDWDGVTYDVRTSLFELPSGALPHMCEVVGTSERGYTFQCACPPSGSHFLGANVPVSGFQVDMACYYSYTEPSFTFSPISSSSIDSLDLSDFKPNDKDIPFLSNYLGTPDQIKFSNISEFQGESKTFTYTDENGDTITKQVNTWHNFAVSPSTVTSSSGDPKLEVSTKTQTDTYKDGQKTSSKTETETTKPSDNEDKPNFVGGGGGSGKETPIDCAFFPTLCKWLDWTQEDAGDEPDLNKIINDADDFEREYKITGGAASCPAPYKLTIPFFAKTFDVSYQPFCDFATYLRYLFLAFCYFTAARYVVRSI